MLYAELGERFEVLEKKQYEGVLWYKIKLEEKVGTYTAAYGRADYFSTVSPTPAPVLPTNTPEPTPTPYGVLCKEMLTLVNEARAEEGLRPYTWGSDLEEIAKRRAVELIEEYENGTIHDGVCTAGENVAKGYGADYVFGLWMNSTGHRALIMNPATEGYIVPEGVQVMADGVLYTEGEYVPGTPRRMACAYCRIYGDSPFWVLVVEHRESK